MGPNCWDGAKRSVFEQCPSGNSRNEGGLFCLGAAARRHKAVAVLYIEGKPMQRRDRNHSGVKFLMLRYLREGRKLTIKKSSKDMCVLKSCDTSTVQLQVVFICTTMA